MLYFLLSYVLITPSLAIAFIVFLFNRLFRGQPAKQFLKDAFFLLLDAPLWVIWGFIGWALVLTLSFFSITRPVAWGVLLTVGITSVGYLVYKAGFADPIVITLPALAGIALGAWQFRRLLAM